MKNEAPVVYCVYSESEITASALLEEAFRLYLRLALAAADAPDDRRAQ